MKIVDIHTHLLRAVIPENDIYASAPHWVRERWARPVEVLTDEGITGWGDAYALHPAVETIVHAHLKPLLMGRDPLDRGPIWETLYARTRDSGQRGVALHAISAVDLVLWDIAGKALGQPIYRLLGGAHRRTMPAYATGVYLRPGADPLSRLRAADSIVTDAT